MKLIMPGDYVELLNAKICLAISHQITHKTWKSSALTCYGDFSLSSDLDRTIS